MIRRPSDYNPKPWHRVCNKHFRPGDDKSDEPELFPWNNYKESRNPRSTAAIQKRESCLPVHAAIEGDISVKSAQADEDVLAIEPFYDCSDLIFPNDRLSYVVCEVDVTTTLVIMRPSTGTSKPPPAPGSTVTRSAKNNRESGAGAELMDRNRTMEDKLDDINRVLSTLITREYMDAKLDKLKEDIKDENRELMDKLEGRIFDLESENHQLRQAVANMETKMMEVEYGQKEQASKQNDLEQHGRKNSLRITGLSDPTEKETLEECVGHIVKFVNEKLKVPLCSGDIDIAHRLGRYSKDKPRNIIVKFTHRRKKQEIIRERRKLVRSGTVIFEDLTKYNQQRLREAFRLNCVKNSFSVDGKLFVILQNGKKRKLSFGTPMEENYLMKDANFSKY